MGPIIATLRTLLVAGLVLGAAVGALFLVDRVNRAPRPLDPGIAAIDGTRQGTRLLILLVDSWCDQAARDSTLFPAVARLRRDGASGSLLGVYEGFTIPAVRAAFTGHAETQLVNLVRNFRFRALPIESFFRDVHGLGRRTLVVAREPFTQFGPVFTERFPADSGRDMYDTDRERPGIALRAYREEPFDVVVCHWESFDWVAHEEGTATARYRASARQTDSVIAAFASARAPDDYLLVYGDHGHTDTGEHKTGFDIPAFWLLIGPGVTAGAKLPPLPMTNLRYVASHALGITLRGGPYDLAAIRQAIPVTVAAGAGTSLASPLAAPLALPAAYGISRAPREYLIALAVFVLAVGVAALCRWLLPPPALGHRDLLRAIGLLAATFALGLALPPLVEPLRPGGVTMIVALYAAGVVAKLLLLRDAGRVRWPLAIVVTTGLALVEFRVLERPLILGVMVLVALVVQRARDEAHRRLALIALLQLLLYFTLRLPIYLFPWVDGFLLAAAVVGRRSLPATLTVVRDVGLVGGAWALACGLLAGNLEWGFLYLLFPAHLVELQVQWFLPFILAKIPLLLLLTLVVARRTPDRALGEVVLVMAGWRFVAVWVARLGGVPTADVWPVAEQGAYLATYVVAVMAWGWHVTAGRAVWRATVRVSTP